MPRRETRNFSIIAHIDHGKSTLSDRIIQICGGLHQRDMREQVLDSMDLERERGITIKAQTVRLRYGTHVLNLIDTPGHVDFSYEVSRSLSACEGALLLVDATQGVEAQTLANVYMALENDLEIIPVLNKVDLPSAHPEEVKRQIEDVIGLSTEGALNISAKTGQGVPRLIEALIDKIPPPHTQEGAPLKALLIDSWYDSYLGVVGLVRVYDGRLQKGLRVRLMASGRLCDIGFVGVFTPKPTRVDTLEAGDIGFIVTNVKSVRDYKIGDTLTEETRQTLHPLPGFKPSIPVVFCGLFPVDSGQFELLRDGLGKLSLNDSSFEYVPETSSALGFGFRCGFLGLLHLEIIQERLSREFDLDLISTAPSVLYQLHLRDGRTLAVHNPADFPEGADIAFLEEPWIKATFLLPDAYLGSVLKLCTECRGLQRDMTYVGERVMLVYELPLNEVVLTFYDRLKSLSRGYASFDYELIDNKEGDLVKVRILINGDPVDALSLITHRAMSESRGRAVCQRLKDLIPRQLFKIALQAAIGGKVIARESIGALRKDVTAKCYGGDITRKRKLLEKQKEGKKRMRRFGKVDVPHSVFLKALKMGDS